MKALEKTFNIRQKSFLYIHANPIQKGEEEEEEGRKENFNFYQEIT
jgi:hypothetical protein